MQDRSGANSEFGGTHTEVNLTARVDSIEMQPLRDWADHWKEPHSYFLAPGEGCAFAVGMAFVGAGSHQPSCCVAEIGRKSCSCSSALVEGPRGAQSCNERDMGHASGLHLPAWHYSLSSLCMQQMRSVRLGSHR